MSDIPSNEILYAELQHTKQLIELKGEATLAEVRATKEIVGAYVQQLNETNRKLTDDVDKLKEAKTQIMTVNAILGFIFSGQIFGWVMGWWHH